MDKEEYVQNRVVEKKRITCELELLKNPKIKFNDQKQIFSNDYSLANEYRLSKDSKLTSSNSCYDGGYKSEVEDHFPRFYYNFSKGGILIPVEIKDRNTQDSTSKKMIFMKVYLEKGWGHYSDFNRPPRIEFPNDLEEIADFLSKKGINDNLLKGFKIAARRKINSYTPQF